MIMKKMILSATLFFALSFFAGIIAQDNKTAQKNDKTKTECCQKTDCEGKSCCDKKSEDKNKECCSKKTSDSKEQKTATNTPKK
jgi:preprotein translocase subunit SecG